MHSDPSTSTPIRTGTIRPLGAFMTPQLQLQAQGPPREATDRRRTGPLRPPPGYIFHDVLVDGHAPIKEEHDASNQNMDEDVQDKQEQKTSPSKKRVTEEERKVSMLYHASELSLKKDKQAILERRKSALSIPDPVIGEGFLSKTANGAAPAPPPSVPQPPTSPFKALSADIEEGADTQVILKRMETQLAQRRASLSPTRPRISHGMGRGSGSLPSLTQTFSLLAPAARVLPFAGMLKREEEHTVLTPSSSTESNAESTQTGSNAPQPTLMLPETPRMDGLRKMFARPQEPAGLVTPAIRGVHSLFREPESTTNNPETPRMDGLRQLFTQTRVPPTPAFDGIGDMMQVDEEEGPGRLADVPEGIEEGGQDETPDQEQEATPTGKGPSKRTLAAQSKVPKRLPTRSRVLTDASTLGDDEASPAPEELPTRSRAAAGEKSRAPEGAVVHRTGRARRNASNSETEKEESVSHLVLFWHSQG